MSLEDIVRLPVDIRVEILSRVERLEDLFQLGRQKPLMKAFMKNRNVFGKWFRRQCGFLETESDEEVNNYVMDLFEYFDIDGGELFVEFRLDGQMFNVSSSNDSVRILTNVPQIVALVKTERWHSQLLGDNYTSVAFKISSPVVQMIRLVKRLEKLFPTFKRRNMFVRERIVFNHKLPFDVLSFDRLSRFTVGVMDYDDEPLGPVGDIVPRMQNLEYKANVIFNFLRDGLVSGEFTVSRVFK